MQVWYKEAQLFCAFAALQESLIPVGLGLKQGICVVMYNELIKILFFGNVSGSVLFRGERI